MSQQKMVLQPILRLWLGLFSGLLLVAPRAFTVSYTRIRR